MTLLKERPKVLELVRLVMVQELSDEQLGKIEHFIKRDILRETSSDTILTVSE
ncbi:MULTISPECIES: hypothetical protein [unclassified Dolichospermum]|uniref:hypothetical protein n=1 Tax=unclassified Dolichospermum TaxID=2622029 RepID=UPI0020C506DB|nr:MULTISPECIES: hypothetical protein [unclassified Dolichospermum]